MVSLSQPCTELYEETYLCNEGMMPFVEEDTCIAALMKFSNNISSCNSVPVEINNLKIQPVGKDRWILYSKAETILSKICENNEITKDKIRGTYFLMLDDNCNVQIGEMTLKTRYNTTSNLNLPKLPIINLPEIVLSESQMQRKPINLDTSDLVNLQQLNGLLKISESEVENNREAVINVKTVSIGTLLLYIIIILGISVTLIWTYCNFKFQNNPSDNSPSDNFEAAGGGVMNALPVLSLASSPVGTITVC